jgi:hypothetical protein
MGTTPVALKPGQLVVLVVPDNPRLDNQEAMVVTPAEWGAHVACRAAASGFFRALHTEMILLAETNGHASLAGACKGTASTLSPRECGYTGNFCPVCYGQRLVRRGSCEYCEDCGGTSGCS